MSTLQIFKLITFIPYPKSVLSKFFVSSPLVTKTRIKTFKMHLACYLIFCCYNFTHNLVFLSVLVFKSHDFTYQYQEQASPTPNIGFSKVSIFFMFMTVREIYEASFSLLGRLVGTTTTSDYSLRWKLSSNWLERWQYRIYIFFKLTRSYTWFIQA